jgi:adenylate kinase
VNVFQRIQPSALVLVECGLSEILKRIRRRDEREMNPILIQRLLEAEREHSKFISRALGVPILNVNASTAAGEILTFLRSSSPAS